MRLNTHNFFNKSHVQFLINYFQYLIQVCFKALLLRKLLIHVLERIVILYIIKYFNFPVLHYYSSYNFPVASLEFLYLHGAVCLHSQLQHDKIEKEKKSSLFINYQSICFALTLSLFFFSNLVICLFLLKYVISLLNLTSLFMQGITSSGRFKMQPPTTNIKRILSYKCTVKRMNVVTMYVLHCFDIWYSF